jgi:hypothetical protein
MTNISDRPLGVGAAFFGPQWKMFGLDVRDSAGNAVVETEAGRKFGHPIFDGSSGPGIFLEPGKALVTEIILNRLYDIGKPGQYSVQVQRDFQPPVNQPPVKSNVVTFQVPRLPIPQAPKPAFSITIAPGLDSVNSGWRMPVKVAVKNISNKTVSLAVWWGMTRGYYHKAAPEFGAGIEVRDSEGELVPLTAPGRTFLAGEGWSRSGFDPVPIRPGEVLEETALIGQLSDIGRPGRYSARATLVDPASGLLVSSNTIYFAVTGRPQGARDDVNPPFVVTVRAIEDDGDPFARLVQVPVEVCATNISDREIKLNNGITENEFQVRNSRGNLVPLTSAGESLRRAFGAASGNTLAVLQDQSECGDFTLADLFELNESGRYAVQVRRMVKQGQTPGQSAGDLPVVRSNIVTVSVDPPSAKTAK